MPLPRMAFLKGDIMSKKKKLEVISRLDKKLLNLKSGDHFIIDLNHQGRRFCEVKIGYKHGRIKPIFESTGTRVTANKLKKKLADTYWQEARTDATYKAWEKDRKHRSRNWEKAYA
jgi:hypothetical protein